MMPLLQQLSIKSSSTIISGATVMILMTSRYGAILANVGGRMYCSSCAPFFAGLIKGPSICEPRMRAPCGFSVIARRMRSSARPTAS